MKFQDFQGEYTDKLISGFFGEYRWLSNFHLIPIEFAGLVYPSTENAYQAAKSEDNEIRKQFTDISPKEARKLGQTIKISDNWDVIKTSIMHLVNAIKFSVKRDDNIDIRDKLLATGDKELVEGNWWHCQEWGVCHCEKCGGVGKNNLGKILMRTRDNIRMYTKEDYIRENL